MRQYVRLLLRVALSSARVSLPRIRQRRLTVCLRPLRRLDAPWACLRDPAVLPGDGVEESMPPCPASSVTILSLASHATKTFIQFPWRGCRGDHPLGPPLPCVSKYFLN